jgi:4-amino-4-deoxy-L-arabinose transferase-like glycosyltransferase
MSEASHPSNHPRSRLQSSQIGPVLVLIALLVIALGLRVWGIFYGIQEGYHPEEPRQIAIALNMIKSGDFNPYRFNYPSVLFYVLAFAYVWYFLFGVSRGVFTSLADLAPPQQYYLGGAYVPFPTQFLYGRGVVILFGLVTVVLVYLVGKRLFGHRAGLIAAAFLAFSPTHALHSHFIDPNVLVTFFTLLAFYFAHRIAETGDRTAYILAGLSAGVAISTKYNVAPILVTLPIAHLMRRAGSRATGGNLLLGLGLIALGFFLGTPYALLDMPTFLNSLATVFGHYSGGHAGHEGSSWFWYLKTLVVDTDGVIPLLALLGTLWGLRTDRGCTILLTAFPLLYYLTMSVFAVRFEWNLLPLLPFVYLLAASFVFRLASLLVSRIPNLSIRLNLVLAVIAGLALLYPAAGILVRDYHLSQEDVRTTTTRWFEQNIPAQARVAQETFGPLLDKQRYQLYYLYEAIDRPLSYYEEEAIDYVVFSEPVYGLYFKDPVKYREQVEAYEVLFDSFIKVKEFSGSFQERTGSIVIYAVP